MQGGVRKRGDNWYYYFEAGNIDGKRKKVERKGRRTKKEAEAALRDALNMFETGYVSPAELTIGQYLLDWLEDYIKDSKKINTYYSYRGLLNNYVLPHISNVKMKDLKPIHLEKMLKAVKKTDISNTTLEKAYLVCSSAFNRAVKLRLMPENPCKFIDKPKRDKYKGIALDVKDLEQFFSVFNIDNYNDYIMMFAIKLDLELGLRRGELAGLEWKNIDFNNKVLSVKNNMIYTNGHLYLDTPKTESSERNLIISDNLISLLRKHMLRQKENKLLYGELYTKNEFNGREYDFVMTWEKGHYVHPLYYTQRFKKMLTKAGLDTKIRFHDLRHTNATILLQQGVDFKTIQVRLGHADLSTTMDVYSHVNLEMQKNAVKKLESALKF